MNKTEFTELSLAPSKASAAHLESLEGLATSFPYCQIAHILIAKISNQQSNMFAKQKLGKAAAYTLDRKKLKSLIALPSIDSLKRPFFVGNDVKDKKSLNEPSEDYKSVEEKSSGLAASASSEAAPLDQSSDDTKEKNKYQIEGFSLSPTKKRSSFFEDLEKNLQQLKDLKNPLAKHGGIEEIQPIHVSPIGDQAIPHSVTLHPLENKPKDQDSNVSADQKTTGDGLLQAPDGLSPIRIEDVVVYGDETPRGADIYVEYVNFLNDKRKNSDAIDDKNNTDSIIDKFLNDSPSIPYLSPDSPEEQIEDLSEGSTQLPLGIVSENFAEILVRQKKYEKAIQMYEELILKNPGKKSYFAEKIELLKNKI